MIIKKFLETH